MKLQVRSRTGHSYFRGPRAWPADAWARVEVDPDTDALLKADPHLQVVDLHPEAPIDVPEVSVEEGLRIEITGVRSDLVRAVEENERLRQELDLLRGQSTEGASNDTSRRKGR